MSRKFITTKELAFIGGITKELTQKVVGQKVLYFAISAEHSVVNDLYGEATKKTWAPPVEINGLVAYDSPTVITDAQTLNTQYRLDLYFHNQELRERNVVVREGDFVEYGQVVYEIASATMPQTVFGQINNKVMTKCVCISAREGQFSIGGSSEEFVDRTTPVESVVADDEVE